MECWWRQHCVVNIWAMMLILLIYPRSSLRAERSNPFFRCGGMDCFACARNDGGHTFAFPRHLAPEVCWKLPALEIRGRRECRMRAAPAVSRAKVWKKRTRAYRFSGGDPTFPAQWFYGLLRALPGGPSLLSPSLRRNESTQLDASIGASGPHDFAVRLMRVRLRAFGVHRDPSLVRDDGQRPSEQDGMAMM
jgi:hypothetical protein